MKNKLPITILILTILFSNLMAQEVFLVKDLKPGDDSGMTYGDIVGAYGSSAVFQTLEDGVPKVLYYTDGTTSGTLEVSGINGFKKVKNTIQIDSSLYVVTKQNSGKCSLVKFSEELDPIILLSDWKNINKLIFYEGKLFFNGEKPDESEYIYSMDIITNEIAPVTTIHWLHSVKDMAVFNNELFFISGLETDALGLFKYHSGLSEGELVYDFKQVDNFYTNINMIATNNVLFFTYLNQAGDYSLFSSDGTANGTIVLDNTLANETWFNTKKDGGIIVHEDKLYIRLMFDEDENRYLLESDGTIAGTMKIQIGSDFNLWPSDMTIINDELFMNSLDGILKLNKQTGNFENIFGSMITYDITELVDFRNKLCFTVEGSNGNNKDIRLSEGTSSQSEKLNLNLEGKSIRVPSYITPAGGNIYFIGYHDSYGKELFVYAADGMVNSINLEDSRFTNIDIFPNPTNNSINFATDLSAMNVKIFDILGKEVLRYDNYSEKSINVEHLINGTYFIIFSNNKILRRAKFVVQK